MAWRIGKRAGTALSGCCWDKQPTAPKQGPGNPSSNYRARTRGLFTMRGQNMSEPISGSAAAGAAGAAAFKAMGGAAGIAAGASGLAAFVVMLMMRPRTRGEWAVALISTLVSSIAGGAAVVQYFELEHWTHNSIGLVALIGLVFSCGLPGWALVRWLFNFIDRRRDKDLADVVGDVRDVIAGGGQHG